MLQLKVQEQTEWFVPFDYENPCYNNTIAKDNFFQQGLDKMKGCDLEEDHVASYENFAVFSLSQYQYIILLIAFAKVSKWFVQL